MAAKYTDLMNNAAPAALSIEFPNNSKGICYYNDGSRKIFVNSDSYNDWDVIQHEYGHYIQYRLGTADSPGGIHYFQYNLYDSSLCTTSYLNKNNAVKLAWGEGWADYFPVSLQQYMKNHGYAKKITYKPSPQSPTTFVVGDSSFNNHNLSTTTIKKGEANEIAVAYILYHLENDSDFLLSNKDLWDIVKSYKMKTLSDLSNYLINIKFNGSINYSRLLELGKLFSFVKVSPEVEPIKNTGMILVMVR
jgi:hypothetical protein